MLLVLACAVVGGCGGQSAEQRLSRADAAPLIALADRIAHEGPCAQARDIRALSTRRLALANAHRIPDRLAASLSAGVQALVVETPACLPAVPAATVPSPPAAEPDDGRLEPEPEHKHGHGHGHGHRGHGHGHEGDD
jgi:hypothetical protein